MTNNRIQRTLWLLLTINCRFSLYYDFICVIIAIYKQIIYYTKEKGEKMKDLGQTLSSYRKKKKISQLDLMDELNLLGFNVTKTAISKWETNVYEPKILTFLAACKIIGITDLYETFSQNNPFNILSSLNDEGKELAQNYIQLLIDSGKYAKKECDIIPFTRTIRLYATAASAGIGEFLNDENFELIEVGDEVPTDADFGVRINGDSMEPRFIHGQIVWARQQEQLSNGEIGIFALDDQAYCKILQDNEDGVALISLNKNYEPISINENTTFKTFGKVVG